MSDDTSTQQNSEANQGSQGVDFTIVVNRDLCIGAAPCVAIAGNVFQLDEEGKAIIIDPNGADKETIRLSAEACPVQAIILYEPQSNVQVFPPV